ncbi:NAD(P)-binding domain-containing protein [Cytophagaceae bacterium DM2B3-1]|uniref:NAD(P)-binding domain-containing protein n=1 Tax=Xanthocytophaga flava TaxID=3048013 RepID=A0ABT7CRG8_9BACT|nr:NAD(P)-binding domain-containing protein [Xanthocytophaga flavus]MDJ1470477.1 NAD(P)-binding domain-containing protein [Xanthocytophaga flavus]MDJ1496317.1 NAD(P)-binding domain-containing protein [Xanthocytophaga flavus]
MKKIGILGTGIVGQTIGAKLLELGYMVMLGSRTSDNEKSGEWVAKYGPNALQGTFNDTVAFGEMLFNCTKGEASLDILKSCDKKHLSGKILIDVSNPLDFSKGMPPILIPELCNIHSLGEAIQEILPDTKVVKTLNIVTCSVMVNAHTCGGDATMLVAGNDPEAKSQVSELLHQFGWNDIMDLGNIRHARSTEMMLPVWLSIYLTTQNAAIAFKIIR